MTTTKRVVLTKLMDRFEEFALREKLPMREKMGEMKSQYKLEEIVGLLQMTLLPNKKDLENYISQELERLKMLMTLFQNTPEIATFEFTASQKGEIVSMAREAIEILEK